MCLFQQALFQQTIMINILFSVHVINVCFSLSFLVVLVPINVYTCLCKFCRYVCRQHCWVSIVRSAMWHHGMALVFLLFWYVHANCSTIMMHIGVSPPSEHFSYSIGVAFGSIYYQIRYMHTFSHTIKLLLQLDNFLCKIYII